MKTIHLLLALLAGVSPSAFAQQRGWPVATNDESGFVQIFDGKTLAGWQGDTNHWRVEDGCLVGEVTTNNLLKQNSFIVWRGGETRDFELKVEYRNFRLKKIQGLSVTDFNSIKPASTVAASCPAETVTSLEACASR